MRRCSCGQTLTEKKKKKYIDNSILFPADTQGVHLHQLQAVKKLTPQYDFVIP